MRCSPSRVRQGIGIAAALLLAACHDNDTGPASIAIATSASTVTVAQGASSTVAVTLTRTNFSDDVKLSAEGVPTGVTATFAPATLSGDATQSTLTIAAGATAAPGTATITVRAQGAGVDDITSAIALTVPQPPAYTLALTPTALSVATGATGTVNIALARTNFTGNVTFAASGLPAGATATFAPNPTSTNASVLTVAAGTATPGTYTVTVTGTAAGLGDRTTTFPLTITAAPSYTMTLASNAATLAPGASTTVNVALARTNFADAITLAATGVPSGATVTFAPSPTTADASVMTVNAGTAAPGTYNITVTGSATGLTDRTATFALTVSTPTGFTLTPSVSTVAISSGSSATVNIDLARTNFTGNVTLAVGGLPAGATATFAPNPATGTSSVLTINTGSAAPGSYPLTITATATGLPDRTVPLTLNVTAVVGTNVQFTFCAEDLPIWVGYQDGTGPWKQASIGPNNTYSFTISGKGGVAIVRQTNRTSSAAGFTTDIYFATASELQFFGTTTCTSPQLGTKTVHGSVAGTNGGFSSIVLFNSHASTIGDGAFTLDSLKNGSHDLLATLLSTTTFNPTRMIIRRSLDPADGSTLPVLDFASSEAFGLSPDPLVLPGVAASTQVFTSSSFSTANGSSTSVGFTTGPASAATYTGVPTANTIASDLETLLVEAMETGGNRGAITYFTGTGTRTFTLGPPLSAPTITSLGVTPYPRLRAQYASQAEYNAIAMVSYDQGGTTSAPSDRTVNIWATPSYFGGVPATWDLSIPDMSAATGFQNIWMLAAGTTTNVTTSGYGGNILTATPAAGTTFYFAQNTSSVTTPTGTSATRLQRSAPTVRSATKLAARSAPVMQVLRNRWLIRRR